MSPMLGSSPGGVLCSSPPAKSLSVPIKAARSLSQSVPCQDVAEGRHSFSRRVSEAGHKLSFGGGRTISITSTPPASGSKPPVAPSAPRAVHVGFAAPESSGLCLSPGRRETKSSLLSRALLDTPTNELFGCAAPLQSFQVRYGFRFDVLIPMITWHGFHTFFVLRLTLSLAVCSAWSWSPRRPERPKSICSLWCTFRWGLAECL